MRSEITKAQKFNKRISNNNRSDNFNNRLVTFNNRTVSFNNRSFNFNNRSVFNKRSLNFNNRNVFNDRSVNLKNRAINFNNRTFNLNGSINLNNRSDHSLDSFGPRRSPILHRPFNGRSSALSLGSGLDFSIRMYFTVPSCKIDLCDQTSAQAKKKIRYTRDCRKYFLCDQIGLPNFSSIQDCPKGTVFEESRQTCVPPKEPPAPLCDGAGSTPSSGLRRKQVLARRTFSDHWERSPHPSLTSAVEKIIHPFAGKCPDMPQIRVQCTSSLQDQKTRHNQRILTEDQRRKARICAFLHC
ncbi:unnamed protein product, partial [Cyprideis torosa]